MSKANSSKTHAPRSSSGGEHFGTTHLIEWYLFSAFSITLMVISMAYILTDKLQPLLLKTGIITVEAKGRLELPGHIGGKARLPEKVTKKPPAKTAKTKPPQKMEKAEIPVVAHQDPDAHLIPWIIAAEMQQP